MILEHFSFGSGECAHGICPHLPNGYVVCFSRHCDRCEIADRIRSLKARELGEASLFTKDNCLKQTLKDGGEIFYRRPVVLSYDVMKKLGLELNLLYQIAYAYDGCGCLPKNKVGPVDLHLFADETFKFTVQRFEILGVPNEAALKHYDRLFFMGLHKKYK